MTVVDGETDLAATNLAAEAQLIPLTELKSNIAVQSQRLKVG